MNSDRARVKVMLPGQSNLPGAGFRDFGTNRSAAATSTAATTAWLTKTPRQLSALISTPEIAGPNAMPRPKDVPSMAKALARPGPCANAVARMAAPLVSTPAAPMPATARNKSSTRMFWATAEINAARPNRVRPLVNIRLRPMRSDSDPAASMTPAKVRS